MNRSRRKGYCCGKASYPTQGKAIAAMERIARTSTRLYFPTFVYRCRRGWWHLTSKQPARRP
jgi:hypothetical protein